MIGKAFACVVLAACATGSLAADPVAFVADLKGNATIEGDGKLAFLSELVPGTRLLLGTGAAVAVTYASSGHEFTLTGPGEFLVTSSEVRVEKGAVPARRAVTVLPDAGVVARVARTATASLRMRGVSPEPAQPALEYPVNTRVTTLRPTLRWKGEATDSATVTLSDASGKEVWKASVKAPAAQAPVKLAPATIYTWTVMTPRGALGEGRFETASAAMMAKADKSRAGAKSFADRVMHALLLQDMGAGQEAREAWARLARERPEFPELAVLAR